MKNKLILLLILLSPLAKAQLNLENISIGNFGFVKYENDKYVLKENDEFKKMESDFTFGKLRIYMLKANDVYLNPNRGIGDYTSLKDAIQDKKIKITELNGGTVNTLEFENISNDTIMILAGEVVAGGKQDRVVSQDLLLMPNSGKKQVSVYCVEHGRWSPKTSGNEFNAYYGLSTKTVRKGAVVSKNQSEVWKRVEEVNAKNKTESSTGTYTQLRNSEELNEELPKYIKHFEDLVNSDTSYIGFVAVTGDTIISCDMFATNRLFKKQSGQLIKASAIEAITNGATVTILATSVLKFLSEFMNNESTQIKTVRDQGEMLIHNGKKIHLNYYKK